MNSQKEPSTSVGTESEQQTASAVERSENSGIKPFAFPFSPEIFAPPKPNDQPWHQKGNKSNHDQRPGAAPRGSRRSMGKR